MDTLPANPSPDTGIDRSGKPNIKEAKYGDGYSQRISIGINQVPITVNLAYSNISATEKQTLENFINEHAAGQAILWAMPDEYLQRKWYISDWNITYVKYGIFNVKMTLQEVFDV